MLKLIEKSFKILVNITLFVVMFACIALLLFAVTVAFAVGGWRLFLVTLALALAIFVGSVFLFGMIAIAFSIKDSISNIERVVLKYAEQGGIKIESAEDGDNKTLDKKE